MDSTAGAFRRLAPTLTGAKLGQRSGATLVAKAYSHLSNVIGDWRFDWIPEGAEPAWTRLKPPTTAVLTPQFGEPG